MSNKWDGVSAIGTWFAGLATLLAVVIALWQGKPKINIRTLYGSVAITESINKILDRNALIIILTNTGNTTINVNYIGFKLPKNQYAIIYDKIALPIIINPAERIEIQYTSKEVEELNKSGIDRYDIIFAVINTNKTYIQKTKLIKKITRFWWWKFG